MTSDECSELRLFVKKSIFNAIHCCSLSGDYFLKMGQPRPLFCLFSFFSKTNFSEKTVGVSRIRTRIVGVDHLTTTTDLKDYWLGNRPIKFQVWEHCLLLIMNSIGPGSTLLSPFCVRYVLKVFSNDGFIVNFQGSMSRK